MTGAEMVAEQHLAGEAGVRHAGVVEVMRQRRPGTRSRGRRRSGAPGRRRRPPRPGNARRGSRPAPARCGRGPGQVTPARGCCVERADEARQVARAGPAGHGAMAATRRRAQRLRHRAAMTASTAAAQHAVDLPRPTGRPRSAGRGRGRRGAPPPAPWAVMRRATSACGRAGGELPPRRRGTAASAIEPSRPAERMRFRSPISPNSRLQARRGAVVGRRCVTLFRASLSRR